MKGFYLLALLMVAEGLLFATGCANSRPSNRQLLATDYSQMTDQELLEYYRQLDDRVSGRDSGGGGLGIGLGMGFGLNSGAVGLGARRGVGGDDPVGALRIRRGQVRLEMSRRGLEP